MLNVKYITLEEYKNIIKNTTYPLSFDGDWVNVASGGKAIYISIEDNRGVLALFVAAIHRKAIITAPFCKYQGWIPILKDLSESEKYNIAKATLEALPKHYYFNLNISDSFVSIESLEKLFFQKTTKIKKKDYQILYTNTIKSKSDLDKQVTGDIRYNYKKSISLGFEVNYSASKDDVLHFACQTAKKKGYKINVKALSSLMDIDSNDIEINLISVVHPKLDVPSLGYFIAKHKDICYCIARGYNNEFRKKIGLYQPNFFTFCQYDYLYKNINIIKACDFQGSSIPEIRRTINKFHPTNKNYISIEYGFRYHPLRFL